MILLKSRPNLPKFSDRKLKPQPKENSIRTIATLRTLSTSARLNHFYLEESDVLVINFFQPFHFLTTLSVA